MSLKTWKQLSSKVLLSNKYWDYLLDEFQIEDGKKGEYHFVRTGGSTMIIPVTDSGKLLFVNQYRYLNQRESLEFPCGSISKNLSPKENAVKELREETGYSTKELIPAGFFSPFNGVTDEMCHVFVANDLVRDFLKADDTEEFELHELSVDKVDELISDNTIWDGMTLAAWILAKKFV
ncbi:MAG: NUDIX hydrolase [Ignavibacteriales bacterium]|nr:MAG: NUDIX hydrolase [Ignavibacteriales bacterium]